jgi:cyclase
VRIKSAVVFLYVICLPFFVLSTLAQDLGPHFTKIKDGIYVQTAKSTPTALANASIIVTSEGVVLVDTGQNATDSREIAEAVKKLTPQPVRFIIDTETHPDHSYGHWLFSPPAVIINHEGAGAEMKQSFNQKQISDQENQSPEMKAALQGFRLIPPQIEYGGDKMTLRSGERTFELLNLGTTHSLANTAVWLPNERVLFAGAVAIEGQINTIRPFTNIPDMLAMMKMMKALNAEVVIPAHGPPTTNKMFDFYVGYLQTLLQRVKKLMDDGKTLDQIKAELRMPEYENLNMAKERIPGTAEAAYRAIKGGYSPDSK